MSEAKKVDSNAMSSMTISKPALKFMIGFFGGLTAALFPRLMAALAVSDSDHVVVISMSYIGISLIFALLVGGGVMIMEWGVAREPRATFMTALGLPALIAGALNTTSGANDLNKLASANEQNAKYMQNVNGIPELEASELSPLSDAGGLSSNPLMLLVINDAHADDDKPLVAGGGFDPSIQVQKQYVIVLDKAASAEEAKQKAESLRAGVPNAQPVKSGNTYLVIDPQPRTRHDAVVNAIRLRDEQKISPSLMQTK